jgi:hypothetical protein
MACMLGAMEFYAKQTTKIEAGDSITQTHGNDRTETVENSHKLTTNKKDIHYQAATDQTHSARDNIIHKADKNIEHKSGEATRWSVSRDYIVTIKQGDQIIKIDDGDLYIEAAKDIIINGTGGGTIRVGQNGGGFEIDAGGNIKLYGNAVTINGNSGVKIKGQVSYGSAVGTLSLTPLAPLAIAAIPWLKSPDAPAESLQDFTFKIDDQFIKQFGIHKTLHDGSAYTLTTDLGDVRKGKISNMQIDEKQLKIDSAYDLQFEANS